MAAGTNAPGRRVYDHEGTWKTDENGILNPPIAKIEVHSKECTSFFT